MSTSRPRPSMHNDVYCTWVWCDDNAQVNNFILNMPKCHHYRTFYPSFINAVNRAGDSARRDESTLQPLDLGMIVCLLQERIPAEMLIDILKKYNKIIDGNKGNFKSKGIIKVGDNIPEMSTIETVVKELKKKIRATRAVVVARYVKEEAKTHGKGKSKAEAKVNGKAHEDQEMQDVDMEDAQPLPQFDEMKIELANAGNTPAASKGKGKAPWSSVTFLTREAQFVMSNKKQVLDFDDDNYGNMTRIGIPRGEPTSSAFLLSWSVRMAVIPFVL